MNENHPINETILDRCITAIYDEGKSIEDCLEQFPGEQEALEPILRLTQRLQAARNLEAPADFRLNARARMEKMITAEPQRLNGHARSATLNGAQNGAGAVKFGSLPAKPAPAPLPAPTRRPAAQPRGLANRPVWVYAVGLALVLVLLVGNSTISLANRALPGDALYPVKTASENAQLFFSPSARADAGLRLQYTDRRYEELVTLAQNGQPERVRTAIRLYNDQVNSVAAYVREEPSAIDEVEAKAEVAEQLAGRLAAHEQRFSALAEDWPPSQPLMSEEEAAAARQDFAELRDTMLDLYAALRDVNPKLPAIDPTLPALVTQVAPVLDWLTATPTPLANPGQFIPTWFPCQPGEDCWKHEWSTTEPTNWPTPGPEGWATPLPDDDLDETIPDYIRTFIPTYWPTYLPTGIPNPEDIPTYFPPGWPPDDEDDEDVPGFPSVPDEPGDEDLPPDWPEFPEEPDAGEDPDFEGWWAPGSGGSGGDSEAPPAPPGDSGGGDDEEAPDWGEFPGWSP